jgi:hypothetical protein
MKRARDAVGRLLGDRKSVFTVEVRRAAAIAADSDVIGEPPVSPGGRATPSDRAAGVPVMKAAEAV